MAEGLAPSGDALIGHHLHYHGAPPVHQALGEGEGLLQRRGQHIGDHIDDLHPSDSLPHLTLLSSLACSILQATYPRLLHRGRPLRCQNALDHPQRH